VVAGHNQSGESCIIRDELAPTRVATPAYTVNGVWQLEKVPTSIHADATFGEAISIIPPPEGFNFFITTFPPDSEYDVGAGYAASLAASGGAETRLEDDGGIPGLHVTRTVDMVTVVSGEMYVVFEEGETLLTPGDTVVQRGTAHTWSNRATEPCTVVSLMVSAKEDQPWA